MSIESLRERVASLQGQMNGTTDPSAHAELQRQLEEAKNEIDGYKGEKHTYSAHGRGEGSGTENRREPVEPHEVINHDAHKSKDGVVDVDILNQRKADLDNRIERGEGNPAALQQESKLIKAHLAERSTVEMQIHHAENDGSHFSDKEKQQMRAAVDEKHIKLMKNDPHIKEMTNSWTFKDKLSATVDDIKDKAHEVIGKVKEGFSTTDKQPEKSKDTPAHDVKPTQQKEKSFSDMLKVEEPKGKGLMDAAKEKAGEMYGKLKDKVNSYVEKVCKSDIEKLPLDHEGKTKGHNIADIAKQPAKDYDGHEKALNADISKDRKDGKLEVTDSHQKEAVKEGIDNIKSHDKDMKALGKEINDQGLRGERFSINLDKQAPEIRKDIQREIKEIPRQMEHARDIKR